MANHPILAIRQFEVINCNSQPVSSGFASFMLMETDDRSKTSIRSLYKYFHTALTEDSHIFLIGKSNGAFTQLSPWIQIFHLPKS